MAGTHLLAADDGGSDDGTVHPDSDSLSVHSAVVAQWRPSGGQLQLANDGNVGPSLPVHSDAAARMVQ